MELVGRLTADAVVREVIDDKKVINFTIAINSSYRPKDSNEVKKQTTYVDCAYWFGTGIAPFLSKGRLVELFGNIGAKAYLTMSGEAKANLTFHVIHIKLGDKPKGNNANEPATETSEPVATSSAPVAADDLPF